MPRWGRRLVFPGIRGGPLNHGWFHGRVWREATRHIESSLRFHDLRHGFASLMLAWEEPILYVSQQLGHSSAAFTLSTYAHLIQQGRKLDKEETLRKLSAAARCERAPRVPQNEAAWSGLVAKPLDRSGAGDRTRTDDLRITSASL